MSILSTKFLIFVVITLVTYYICVPKYRWCVLLAASAGFFLSTDHPALFLVFVAMSLCAWGAALLIQKSTSERAKTAIAATVVIAELAVLILYKDNAFFILNANRVIAAFGGTACLTLPTWAAPLGISYYTLILIGYILDVRWGTVSVAQKNPLKLIAFSGYFPQIVTGPFTRYNEMAGPLFDGGKFRFSNVWSGAQRILWGLFKVVVISTRLSILVSAIFDAQVLALSDNPYTGIAVPAGAILYVFYVYMNFSGSMDIVIGISETFGIPLAENFLRPFTATNLSEVWRKWHLTLGFWLKDYVLYPVLKSAWMNKIRKFCKDKFGRKASKDIPTYIGMLISWFCVGFWHGGTWKFICGSGLFFFVMIVGGLILKPVFLWLTQALHINTDSLLWRMFQRVRTFLLFAFSVSFGRAESLSVGLHMWRNLFRGLNLSFLSRDVIKGMGLAKTDCLYVAVGLVLVILVSYLQEKHGSVRQWMAKKSVVINILVAILLVVAIFMIGGMDTKIDFMYGNF